MTDSNSALNPATEHWLDTTLVLFFYLFFKKKQTSVLHFAPPVAEATADWRWLTLPATSLKLIYCRSYWLFPVPHERQPFRHGAPNYKLSLSFACRHGRGCLSIPSHSFWRARKGNRLRPCRVKSLGLTSRAALPLRLRLCNTRVS